MESVAIAHTHALPERIAELHTLAAGLPPQSDILTKDITLVIGVYIGPGAMGFAVAAALK